MEVSFPATLLQALDFIVVEPPANQILELLPADLLVCLFLLGGPEARLEARLHAYADGGAECYALCVAADLGAGGGGLFDAEELFARGLQGEGGGVVGNGDDEEGFFGGHGGCGGAEDAVFVAAEVSVCC
jgi:hypothetical protein